MSNHRKLTQAEFHAEIKARFGDDPLTWAFRCPHCDDVATGQDFRDVLAAHPRTELSGEPTITSDLLGQECIGRTLGALKGPAGTPGGKGQAERGCDWFAHGLFKGPWEVVMPDGRSVWGFSLADAPGTVVAGTEAVQ